MSTDALSALFALSAGVQGNPHCHTHTLKHYMCVVIYVFSPPLSVRNAESAESDDR